MKHQREHNKIQQELEEMAPGLARLRSGESPIEIPPAYFDRLSEEIWMKLQTAPAPKPVISWRERRRDWLEKNFAVPWKPAYAYAIAAVAVVVIGTSVLFQKESRPIVSAEVTLSDEDIETYINAHLDEFDLRLLAEESTPDPIEADFSSDEDSLNEQEMDRYFDELLDEIELEELL
jgi:hypothetical protein